MYDPADVELPIAPADAEPASSASRGRAGLAPGGGAPRRGRMRALEGAVLRHDQRSGQSTRVASWRRLRSAASGTTPWSSLPRTTESNSAITACIEKMGFFPQSYHISGIWRDPARRGGTSGHALHRERRPARDAGRRPRRGATSSERRRVLDATDAGEDVSWRRAAHYEWDSRFMLLERRSCPVDRATLARRNLAVSVGEDIAFVQFGDGSMKCFDLAAIRLAHGVRRPRASL